MRLPLLLPVCLLLSCKMVDGFIFGGGGGVPPDHVVEMYMHQLKTQFALGMFSVFYETSGTEMNGTCLALFDPTRSIARIKGISAEEIPIIVPGNYQGGPTPPSGTPFSSAPTGIFFGGISEEFPSPGKAVTLIQPFNPEGGTPVPTISLTNAGKDAHGRPYPVMKVKMGDPGTGFYCTMHHGLTLPLYCNGKLIQGWPDLAASASTPFGFGTSNDITSIVNNNQVTTTTLYGALVIIRADFSQAQMIFPVPYGWMLFMSSGYGDVRAKRSADTKYFRKKRFIGIGGSDDLEFEVSLGLCSIDANPEIGGGEGTGMVGPDRFRADNLQQLYNLYIMDDDGDFTGATYARESITTPADDSEVDDPEVDLGAGSEAGGHCPIVTAEVERNFKKTCKVNKKIEKTCGIFTSSAGPLKDCLASTAGTLTMFNAAAAYEECRLSICARVPAKKLCHVLKQQVDLCHKQHVAGGKSHPANALWRSVTNCKFDKIKKKGDPNGVVACIDPRERPSCWKPDGCNRLPDIDDSPHECDERMVCNDGHLWNGKKCVKSGSC